MDNLWVAFILSIVEGLTEYLPVSSSGHLVLVGDLLNFSGEKAATFQVVIQLGAIMAVVVLYWERFWGLLRPQQGVPFAGLHGIWMLFLTCLPACVLGLLLHAQIKSLFTPGMVLIPFVIGALLMIFVERRQFHPRYETLDDMTPGLAFGIGCFQCLALFPGLRRKNRKNRRFFPGPVSRLFPLRRHHHGRHDPGGPPPAGSGIFLHRCGSHHGGGHGL